MMPKTLDIQLLGTFNIRYGETVLAEDYGVRLQSLLAYLVLHRDAPQSRQKLAFLFWPNSTDAQARANLRNLLYRLRKTLPDGDRFLQIESNSVQWKRDAPFCLDVADWSRALAQAEQATRIGDQAAARDALERAVTLYQGNLLPDSYEDWILPERERLQQAFLDALGRLISMLEEDHEYEAAIERAQRLLHHDPLHEPSYRALMRLNALTHNRPGALRVYDTCVSVMQRELGVEPEPETTALYERIRDGAELRLLSTALPHNLPAELTPFVGREALLAEIAEQLDDSDCRLLTLIGPGGSGKTRLALKVANALLAQRTSTPFEDGLFFVSLASLRSSEGMAPAVASAVGFAFYQGATPRQQLLSYLRQKRMLVILDNVEHLIAPAQSFPEAGSTRSAGPLSVDGNPNFGAASLMLDMLHAAPGVKIVATSRIRLNVRGEHLISIEGMHYPKTLPDDVLEIDRYSAVKLFLASAREVRHGFQPTTNDIEHVVRICQLVQGMPLALVLAAAWMELLTPAEIAHELDRAVAIDFLAAEWSDAPERQRSMRAVFDHSWSLLTGRERVVFQALSAFRGGFTREAAEQVIDASLRELMSLVNKSLLHRDTPSRGGRYEIHELLRQYAEEHLAGSPDAERAMRDRHAAYYADALARWAVDLNGERQAATVIEMDAEIENARAAWGWAAGCGNVEQLDRALDGLNWYYFLGCRYQEGATAFGEAAERLTAIREQLVRGEPSARSGLAARVLIRTLSWQSNHLRELEQRELARQCLEQAQAILKEPDLDDQDLRLEKAMILREVSLLQGREHLARAIDLHEQSLALFQEVRAPWWIGVCLRVLGNFYSRLGQYDKGQHAIEESRAIYRALGNPWQSARGAGYLAISHLHRGQIEPAERLARETLATYRELRNQAGIENTLETLGLARLYAGAYLDVQPLMDECLAICSDLGLRPGWPSILLGATNLHLGRYGRAHALTERGLALVREEREPSYLKPIALSLNVLGLAALVEGRIAEATQWVDESNALCQEQLTQNELGITHAYLGYVAHAKGVIDQAWHHVGRALQIGAALGDIRPLVSGLPLIALLLAERREAARAVELYALASCHSHVANSRWFEDVAGKHIAAVAKNLAPEVAAAAKERGRARDLEATVQELLIELEVNAN